MVMCVVLSTILLTAAAAAATHYQRYILAPPSRTLHPVTVFTQHGPVEGASAVLEGHQVSRGTLVLNAFNSSVTYDFGKNVAGWVNFNVSSPLGSIAFTFTESSMWVSSEVSDATAAAGFDSPLFFNITRPGQYVAPNEKERGAFRYLTVVNLGKEALSIKDLWVHFAAMPHWADDALQSYTGWFHSNDEKLNRVWYAGAYTNQLVTIDPTRGDALNFVGIINSTTPVNGTIDWWLNTTISQGSSVLTDGAKRDRLVWAGDMAISLPSVAVSTYDMISSRNALDSLFALQEPAGKFPYVGAPFGQLAGTSFTYHLYALIAVANYVNWDGDRAYLDEKWPRWKTGLGWATQQIDSSGLANVTASLDWFRFGMGGHNIEANSILFHTLNLGVALARTQGDHTSADHWTQLANGVQAAALSLLWQPSVGLFRDNETTTLAPQDGNAWAVKSGLASSPSRVLQISRSLQARWGPFGAPAVEALDTVSPFASGFELEAHFLANRTDAALALVRNMWADYMLDDPRMTNSTFIEGYSVSGEVHYPSLMNDPLISHAHGWSTGPTYSLTTFVGGIQLLSDAGATWAIVPQVGDLSHVDAGFATSKGRFSSEWTSNGSTFTLKITTPKGTTGTVGIPLPGTHTKVTVTGIGLQAQVVNRDASGRYWINGLSGGEYEFSVVGL